MNKKYSRYQELFMKEVVHLLSKKYQTLIKDEVSKIEDNGDLLAILGLIECFKTDSKVKEYTVDQLIKESHQLSIYNKWGLL